MHQKYYHATKPKWQAYQKEYGVKWRKDNFERRKASHKKWLEKHPNWRSEYERKLRKEDPQFKLTQNLRRRVRSTIAKGFKSASTFTLLGCTIDEFKLHIESQWTEGMSWDNYGLHGWHIDHIKPCYAFDLTKPEEQRACFHFSNQRPLWQKDNDSRKRPGWHEIWKNRKPPKA